MPPGGTKDIRCYFRCYLHYGSVVADKDWLFVWRVRRRRRRFKIFSSRGRPTSLTKNEFMFLQYDPNKKVCDSDTQTTRIRLAQVVGA